MEPAASIKRMGFRRWYERQLIDSHLSLVTCFLAMIAFAACLEAVRFENFGWEPVALLAVVTASLPVAFFSWRRFMRILGQAERYGECSTCTACGTYGRLEVAQTGSSEIPREPGDTGVPRFEVWMSVRCRKCGHAWRMPNGS